MHVEICACLRLLARLNYIMGDYSEVSKGWDRTRVVLLFLPHPCCGAWLCVTCPWVLCSVQALSNQQKAVLMSERVLGIEHPNTIQEYVSTGCGGSSSTSCGLLEPVSLKPCLQLENSGSSAPSLCPGLPRILHFHLKLCILQLCKADTQGFVPSVLLGQCWAC